MSLTAACVLDDPGGGGTADPPDTVAQPLAAAGMERLIPIRFTSIRDCATTPCVEKVNLTQIQAVIGVTNRIFAPAGIQVYVEKFDEVDLPFMQANWTDQGGVTFASIKAELALVFPQMPLDAFTSSTIKTVPRWLAAVQAIYEDNRRIHVWITPAVDSEDVEVNSEAPYPERGRHIQMLPGNLKGTQRHFFAHELGHFLGLPHPMDVDVNLDRLDPETLQPWKLSDNWDLVFKRGTSAANPHVYFNSRSAAAAVESQLTKIEFRVGVNNLTNCMTDNALGGGPDLTGHPPGAVVCVIGSDQPYWEYKYTGDAAMKGIGRAYPDGRRGKNLMAYDTADGADTMPVFLSDSQIHQLRKYLRWDIPFSGGTQSWMLDGFQYTTGNMGGRRPRLGHARAAEPAPTLDFDGDGERDLGYWIAPTTTNGVGEFRVQLSSHNLSASPANMLIVALGRAGDVAVPADYNGDGRTDVAVYQAGGGLARNDVASHLSYWRYCLTNATDPTATTCPASDGVPVQFGTRQDVPIFGHDFNGVAGSDLGLYRASTSTFYVRNLAQSWGKTKVLGAAGSGNVPLVGLYDCDGLADLAVYEPTSARFKLMLSADDWTATVTHQFDSDFVPLPTGADRAAPIALSSMVSPRYCTIGPGIGVFRPRRAAALWYPPAGQWNIIWSPSSTSSTIEQCGWGDGDTDSPLPGVDRNGDGRSDLALFRPATSAGGNGTFHLKNAVAGACTGASSSHTCHSCGPDVRTWANPDLGGDGRRDILMLDLNESVLRRYRSEDDFDLNNLHTVPALNAQIL